MPAQHDPEGIEIKYLRDVASLTNARVLEIGCGDGRLTWDYATATKYVAATDPNPQKVALASRDCPPRLHPSVTFVQSPAEALPFSRKTFDLVLTAWSF